MTLLVLVSKLDFFSPQSARKRSFERDIRCYLAINLE